MGWVQTGTFSKSKHFPQFRAEAPQWKCLTKAVAADGQGPAGHSGGDCHTGWKAVKDIYQPFDF